jgi:hypothetical protein
MSKYAAITGTVAIADPDDPTNVLRPTLPNIAPVTPSDSADLDNTGILLIGTGGNVKITLTTGATVVVAVPAGYLYVPVVRVWSTSTTATGISVLY